MITSTINQELGKQKLAIGVKVSNNVKPPMEYLLDAKEYDTTDSPDIKKQMRLCNQLYRYEGMLGNAVDVLIEFATTDIWAEKTGNDDLDNILKFFNAHVNSKSTGNLSGIINLFEKIFFEYLVNGNGFPYEYWEKFTIPGMTRDVSLPSSISCMNPQTITIPEESVAFGDEIIFYTPDMKMIHSIRSDGRSNPESMIIKKSLPQSIVRKIKANKFGGTIPLDKRFISHIKRKGRDYSAWGIPFLTRTFSSISLIKKMRKLDEATIEGLIGFLTIFKVGTDEFPADEGRMDALKNLLEQQKASTNLVWAHDLEVDTYGPDGKILSFKDRYTEAFKELKRAVGVAAGLLGDEDDNVTYEDLLAMAQRLETMRGDVISWVNNSVYRKIAVENGFTDIYPKAKMARMNIYDDNVIKTHVTNLYDRGLIGPETALVEAGYDYDSILESKKRNKKEVDKGTFGPPDLPFSTQDNRTGVVPEKNKPDTSKPDVKTKNALRNIKKEK